MLPALPIGSVLPFAGAIGGAPAIGTSSPIERWGWTACDGRPLPTGRYPALFAAIGYRYGGSGASFNLPDYRGYFLRGVDGGAGNDPDAAARTAPPGGTAAGVGSLQQDALQLHAHPYQGPGQQVVVAQQGLNVPNVQEGLCTGDSSDQCGGRFTTETRPKNVYVNFIIRFA